MYLIRKLYCLLFVIVLTLIMACGNTIPKAGKAVVAFSNNSYDYVLTEMNKLHDNGLIDDDVRDRTIEYAEKYMEAHNDAAELLAQYLESSQDKKLLYEYLDAAFDESKAITQLLAIYHMYKHLKEDL